MDAKEQWALVSQIRSQLLHDDEKQGGCGLEASWHDLEISGSPYLSREQANFSEFVLSSIVSWIEEIDDYPPPELLLAMCAMFHLYMEAGGNVSLEEAFFGRPKQRLGSYASREAKRDPAVDIGFALAFHGGKHRGMSDAAAAAFAQAEVERKGHTCPDADTLLKRMQRKRTKKP